MPRRLPGLQTGEQLLSSDGNLIGEACLDKIGALSTYLLGQASINSGTNPLTFSVDGSNNVTIGGANQQCILEGRVADEIGAQTFAVPINGTGSPRVDFIAAAPVETPANPQLRNVKIAINVVTPNVSIPQLAQGIAWAYVPAGGTVPSGYTEVLKITVPASSGLGGVTAGACAMLLPTPAQALATALGLPFINALCYTGFDKTGSTDSTAALLQALDDAATLGVHNVLFAGRPKATALAFPSANVALRGAGSFSTQLNQFDPSQRVINNNGVTGYTISGFLVLAAASPTSNGIVDQGCSSALWDDIVVSGFVDDNIDISDSQNYEWRSVRSSSSGNSRGVVFTGFGGNFKCVDGDFSGNGSHGFAFVAPPTSAGMGALFTGTRFSANGAASTAAGLFLDTNILGVSATGCRFGQETLGETSTQSYGVSIGAGADDICITGSPMYGNAIAPVLFVGACGPGTYISKCPPYGGNVVASLTPSATGVPQLNPYGIGVWVRMNPNSGSPTEIDIAGVSFATGSPLAATTFWWPAGVTITLHYTGAPTYTAWLDT